MSTPVEPDPGPLTEDEMNNAPEGEPLPEPGEHQEEPDSTDG